MHETLESFLSLPLKTLHKVDVLREHIHIPRRCLHVLATGCTQAAIDHTTAGVVTDWVLVMMGESGRRYVDVATQKVSVNPSNTHPLGEDI